MDRERAETCPRLLAGALERGTAWIELSATGRSAEVRVTLPLSSRYPEAHFDDGVRSPW